MTQQNKNILIYLETYSTNQNRDTDSVIGVKIASIAAIAFDTNERLVTAEIEIDVDARKGGADLWLSSQLQRNWAGAFNKGEGHSLQTAMTMLHNWINEHDDENQETKLWCVIEELDKSPSYVARRLGRPSQEFISAIAKKTGGMEGLNKTWVISGVDLTGRSNMNALQKAMANARYISDIHEISHLARRPSMRWLPMDVDQVSQ